MSGRMLEGWLGYGDDAQGCEVPVYLVVMDTGDVVAWADTRLDEDVQRRRAFEAAMRACRGCTDVPVAVRVLMLQLTLPQGIGGEDGPDGLEVS